MKRYNPPQLRFLFVFLIWSGVLSAKPAIYRFCVSSSNFKTFQAEVSFKAVDFGETAARQMLINHLKEHIQNDLAVHAFSTGCNCKAACPVLQLSSENWDGKLYESEATTLLGSAAEAIDVIVYNSQQLFRDPGAFIRKSLAGLSQD